MEVWRGRLAAVAAALRCTRAEAVALAVLLAGSVAGLALVWWLARPDPDDIADDGAVAAEPPATPSAASPDGGLATRREPVVVHVAGAVAEPGMVEVPAGARVADAIEAAGGADPGIDLAGVNLARVVADGEQIVVADADAGDPAAAADGRVDVNRADADALEDVPGIGPVTAERLISHRRDHGPFTSDADLLAVPGIGEATLEQLREHLRW